MILKKPPMTAGEADAARFESRHGLQLPSEYREFVLATNGGHVDGRFALEISPRAGRTTLQQFYRLRDSSRSTQSLDYMRSLIGSRLPGSLLAIGSDLGGGKICLGVSGSESGKVFFWDPGADFEDTEHGSFENITEVAPSFSEFLKRVHAA